MTDLDELERLAREAPPGPWRYNGYFVEDANGNEVRTDAYKLSPYIAAASPDAILDLIARVRAAEGTVALLSDEIRRKGLTSGSAMAAHLAVELEQMKPKP